MENETSRPVRGKPRIVRIVEALRHSLSVGSPIRTPDGVQYSLEQGHRLPKPQVLAKSILEPMNIDAPSASEMNTALQFLVLDGDLNYNGHGDYVVGAPRQPVPHVSKPFREAVLDALQRRAELFGVAGTTNSIWVSLVCLYLSEHEEGATIKYYEKLSEVVVRLFEQRSRAFQGNRAEFKLEFSILSPYEVEAIFRYVYSRRDKLDSNISESQWLDRCQTAQRAILSCLDQLLLLKSEVVGRGLAEPSELIISVQNLGAEYPGLLAEGQLALVSFVPLACDGDSLACLEVTKENPLFEQVVTERNRIRMSSTDLDDPATGEASSALLQRIYAFRQSMASMPGDRFASSSYELNSNERAAILAQLKLSQMYRRASVEEAGPA